MSEREAITVADAAEALGITVGTIRLWISEGKVEYYLKLGSRKKGYRIYVDSLRAYLAGLTDDQGHGLRALERWLAARV